MSSFTAHLLIVLLGGLLLTHHCVQGQPSKVSSKLDFDESDGSNNQNQTGSPGQPGQAGGTGNGNYDPGTGRSLSGGGGSAGGGSGGTSTGGNRPKIHGVRVTVDTGDGQQQTKEDASVPIFKGRGGSDSKHKTRKPYDPKSQWNPNFSGEQHGYQGANRGGYQGSNRGDYYPQYYPGNVYTGGSSDAGSIYRNGETWTHYVPVWTTERVPQEQGQIYRRPSWKPCYCMSSTEFRRRRDSKARREQTDQHKGVINSGVVQVVDGKLERPFS
ncbi:putative glycine-rich cell wall structural protein 1 isoform X2 [Drosophila sechellia]|uniref:putative glycine-rich cell wall structural protein 1 isoform X2 n=1 Tax=Drosophila sechellia TaxID=7238 RepID=UPI0013DE2A8A|nr:putative glycine-rich cell wall structural protein 1 isoform X2 [Drosophila sechellia]